LRTAGLDIEAGGVGAEFNVTRKEPSADAWREHWAMCCQPAKQREDEQQMGALTEAGCAPGAGSRCI